MRNRPPRESILTLLANRLKLLRTAVICGIFLPGLATAGNTLLHSFAGATGGDGRNPSGLMLIDDVFYGTTGFGGPNNGQGILFRMNRDGTGYSILHTFHGGSNDGARPVGKLIISGTTIYGVSQNGGSSNFGTVYSMDLTGTNFIVLHTFTGGTNDGEIPQPSIVLVGSTLYGVAEQGGQDNLGVIYKVNTDTTGFGILHSFATGPGDGRLPIGGLTLAGLTLYGTTAQGGSKNNAGTLFEIGLNGRGYAILHEFSGVQGDGYNPEKDLTLVNDTLYGVTNQGGTAGTGSIFKISTSGTDYAVLYSFEGTNGNHGAPSSPLTVVGDHFVGTTDPIDNSVPDLVYSIRNDGSDFGVLYTFNGPTTEGREPGGALVVSAQNVFGMAGFGGVMGVDGGVIFSLPLPFDIVSVDHPGSGQFDLTGKTFSNSPITIQILPELDADPISSVQISADSNGTFHFDDLNASPSPRFYRVTMP